MNFWFLIPLIACILNINLVIYISARCKQRKLVVAYSGFVLTIAAWEAMDFIMWMPTFPDAALLLSIRVESFVWIFVPFLFLNFIFLFTKNQRNLAYYLLLFVIFCFGLTGLFTNSVLESYQKLNWGVFTVPGALFLPVVMISGVLPTAYALFLLIRGIMLTDNRLQRQQYVIILLGLLVTFLIAMLAGPIYISLSKGHAFPPLTSTAVTLQSFFVAYAVLRLNFLNARVMESVYDIFSKIHDGVIIADNNQYITEQLRHARKEILEQGHKSEIADITTGTLHNVKNILTSVKVSSEVAMSNLIGRSIKGYKKANEMLRDNMNDIEAFITENPKGRRLMMYYLKLEEIFDLDIEESRKHLTRAMEKIDAIEGIISLQQVYAGNYLTEELNITDIIQDAIVMQQESIANQGIWIVKDFADVPLISIQRTKCMHILINLIRNAGDGMSSIARDDKRLTFKVSCENQSVIVRVSDTGSGISSENLKKLFTHGFTTKSDGHGFGLHSCANYMSEMGGNIRAESDGQGKGATFILEFPV